MYPSPLEPYRSARLIYRAPEETATDDAFFHALYSEPTIGFMASPALLYPLSTKAKKEMRADAETKMFMGVMICIIPDDPTQEPETIGMIWLKKQPIHLMHNRTYEFGITIAGQYQDKGYGSEAISWMLDWSFLTAGLHRVELTVYEWNERAQRTYEKLGFVTEGCRRECLWRDGRWWDCIHMGILAHEWKAKKDSLA
ncbi:hypothetical protein N7490_004869 [Penicillium lividum]|nr:hypothetical protein N7490_004869 [Penicillium lividum]